MNKSRLLLKRMYNSTAFRLILIAFIVYNINLRSITSFDTNPTRYLPISILKEFDLDLDEFPFLHKYPERVLHKTNKLDGEREKNDLPYFVRHVRGHYMSTYPVMPAILSLPVYVLPVLFGLTDGPVSFFGFTQTEIVGTFLSKISASAAVAISVGILYLALLGLTNRRSALWIALIYGFATSSWAVSSQGLWQSSMSQPALALTFYFLIKARDNPNYITYSGIPLALSVACHPPNIIFGFVFLIYVFHYYRSHFLKFIVFPAILGTLLIIYNMYYFGTLTGGYIIPIGGDANPTGGDSFTMSGNTNVTKTDVDFYYPRLSWLLGLLISPGRGLFVYSPVLIFGVLGLVKTLYTRRDPLLDYIGIATIFTLLFYSIFPGWHGSFGYSYRLLVDILPGLCLLMAVVFNWIFSHRLLKGLLIVFFGFSVFIQIIGVFFYPCGWYGSPVPLILDNEYLRVWDWRDPEFMRCLLSGPVAPEGFSLLKDFLIKH